MRSNADRPEVTAATRKNSRARKKPVMSAMRARQDPTCYQRESLHRRLGSRGREMGDDAD